HGVPAVEIVETGMLFRREPRVVAGESEPIREVDMMRIMAGARGAQVGAKLRSFCVPHRCLPAWRHKKPSLEFYAAAGARQSRIKEKVRHRYDIRAYRQRRLSELTRFGPLLSPR